MKKKINSIIFDLDGTLIDSGPDLLDSLNFVLKKNNMAQVEKHVLGNLVGGGAEAMIRKGFNYLNVKIDESKIQDLINIFLDFYYKNCAVKTQLYMHVLKTLVKLKNSNIKIGICTNKKQYLTEKILKSFEIDNYFDVVVGSSEMIPLKPSSKMLELCLNKLESKPENSLMIGDSDKDIIPANELGIFSVFVEYGYGKLHKIKPSLKIKNINDLFKYIKI